MHILYINIIYSCIYTRINRVKSERLKWRVAFEMIEVVPFLVLEHFFAQSRTMVAVYTVFLHVSVTFPIVLSIYVYIFCLVFVHFRLELHAIHGIGFLIETDKLQGCVGWVFNRTEFCYLLPDWFPDMISPCVLKLVKILHERVWWQTRACEIGHDSPLVLDFTCEKLKMIAHHVLHDGFSTKLSSFNVVPFGQEKKNSIVLWDAETLSHLEESQDLDVSIEQYVITGKKLHVMASLPRT